MKAIIVTGTPGCGKTTFAKKFAKDNNFKYIDVKKVISDNELCFADDKHRDCIVVDENVLADKLVELIKNSKVRLVIDSHMSHFISSKYVLKCYVCRCELGVLEKRLKNRRYLASKIKENLESEIMEVCLQEAYDFKHNVVVVDCS